MVKGMTKTQTFALMGTVFKFLAKFLPSGVIFAMSLASVGLQQVILATLNVLFSEDACIFTSDKGGGNCICPRLSVCMSVCLLARLGLLKNTCMKCCVSTDVGTWTNSLTFEPDPDYSPDAGTRLPSPTVFTSGKSDVYAAATRDFNMVSLSQWAQSWTWVRWRSIHGSGRVTKFSFLGGSGWVGSSIKNVL